MKEDKVDLTRYYESFKLELIAIAHPDEGARIAAVEVLAKRYAGSRQGNKDRIAQVVRNPALEEKHRNRLILVLLERIHKAKPEKLFLEGESYTLSGLLKQDFISESVKSKMQKTLDYLGRLIFEKHMSEIEKKHEYILGVLCREDLSEKLRTSLGLRYVRSVSDYSLLLEVCKSAVPFRVKIQSGLKAIKLLDRSEKHQLLRYANQKLIGDIANAPEYPQEVRDTAKSLLMEKGIRLVDQIVKKGDLPALVHILEEGLVSRTNFLGLKIVEKEVIAYAKERLDATILKAINRRKPAHIKIRLLVWLRGDLYRSASPETRTAITDAINSFQPQMLRYVDFETLNILAEARWTPKQLRDEAKERRITEAKRVRYRVVPEGCRSLEAVLLEKKKDEAELPQEVLEVIDQSFHQAVLREARKAAKKGEFTTIHDIMCDPTLEHRTVDAIKSMIGKPVMEIAKDVGIDDEMRSKYRSAVKTMPQPRSRRRTVRR